MEQDIQDKSQGDLLAKSLVLLQVTWFVLQIIARAIQHLAITTLEIVTLAFAILNFFTYFCWWNKPLDVNRPIQVTADYISPPNIFIITNTSIPSAPETTPVSETTPISETTPVSETTAASFQTTLPLHSASATPSQVLSGALLPLSGLRPPENAVVNERPAVAGPYHSNTCRALWSILAAATQYMLRALSALRTGLSATIRTFHPLNGSAIAEFHRLALTRRNEGNRYFFGKLGKADDMLVDVLLHYVPPQNFKPKS
ncbi:hypothetical protein DXG01_014875 [Tephrocybe rancida]|nr:hypothetical protein DXG01_014875 [Tephrocybe rancida]